MKICSVEGCGREVHCKAMCKMHYQRSWVHGDPLTLLREKDKRCSIEGCEEKHEGFGYCKSHYKRFKLHGDPLVVKAVPRGQARTDKTTGYRVFNKTPEHRIVAAKALGKPLPAVAVVHHVDENRENNDPSNLVICPDNKYHRLIHQRLNAFNATGHYDWRKCPYCKQYDDPQNMRAEKCSNGEPRCVHVACRNGFQNSRRKKVHVSV